jgi:hypothetical protein
MTHGIVSAPSWRIMSSVLAACMLLGGSVAAQDWYPSKYGADDEIGAANLLSPEKVLAAAQLITTGKTYPLGVGGGRGTPAVPPRRPAGNLFAADHAHGAPDGAQQM